MTTVFTSLKWEVVEVLERQGFSGDQWLELCVRPVLPCPAAVLAVMDELAVKFPGHYPTFDKIEVAGKGEFRGATPLITEFLKRYYPEIPCSE